MKRVNTKPTKMIQRVLGSSEVVTVGDSIAIATAEKVLTGI